MTLSLRKSLLINVLLVLSISAALTSIGNYYLGQKEIDNYLDNLLSETALSFKALIYNELKLEAVKIIQSQLNKTPVQAGSVLKKKDEYNFQIWDKQENLLLHSINAPAYLIGTGKEGFSDALIGQDKWRAFTVSDPELPFKLVLAENYSLRNHLKYKLIQNELLVMLLIFPLVSLLLWIVIIWGLRSIKRIANEVSHRAVDYLEPVTLKEVPKEVKFLIDELNMLFLRLQQAFNREQRFAADAAHELRTPLAGLKTQTQVALLTKNPQERKQILEEIIKSVDRSAHVVQQLLIVSKLVTEKQNLDDFKQINFVKLTAEVIASLVPFALEKALEIELDTKQKSFYILGNKIALGILIRNLVDNAIRYTPEHGQIKVTISSQNEQILWQITDTGPGIPVELRSRIFERFFRILGNQSPGCGLGLAIVQQIAELHHADLNVSSPDEGTGLIVTLRFKKYKP